MIKLTNVCFYGADRYETAAEVATYFDNPNSGTVIVASGLEDKLVDSCVAAPLAQILNAPILLTGSQPNLPPSTQAALGKLKPNRVYIIGGDTSVPLQAEQDIRNICKNASIIRLGGTDRTITCYNVLKEIVKYKSVDTLYVVGAYEAEADGLSISPHAGQTEQVIALVHPDRIPDNIRSFIQSQNFKDAYVIGGTRSVSDQVLREIGSLIGKDITNNRISGATRIETNTAVNKKFYDYKNLNAVFVTKAYVLADAVVAGAFSAKLDAPVVFANNSLTDDQKDYLVGKQTDTLYEVGANIGTTVVNQIRDILREEY